MADRKETKGFSGIYRRKVQSELDAMGYPGKRVDKPAGKISAANPVERSPVWRLALLATMAWGGAPGPALPGNPTSWRR